MQERMNVLEKPLNETESFIEEKGILIHNMHHHHHVTVNAGDPAPKQSHIRPNHFESSIPITIT